MELEPETEIKSGIWACTCSVSRNTSITLRGRCLPAWISCRGRRRLDKIGLQRRSHEWNERRLVVAALWAKENDVRKNDVIKVIGVDVL